MTDEELAKRANDFEKEHGWSPDFGYDVWSDDEKPRCRIINIDYLKEAIDHIDKAIELLERGGHSGSVFHLKKEKKHIKKVMELLENLMEKE